MHKIDTYLTQSLIKDDLVLKDKNVIVVDVLRATTTITTALENGAREVIPAESVTTAARISKGLGNSLLCGERGGKVVEGFNLGNSPFEYKSEIIKGKPLVFSSTNGTLSITKARLSKSCALASFINLSKAVEYIRNINNDIVFVCSGKLNEYCIEDSVCTGLIIYYLMKSDINKYELDDSSLASLHLAKHLIIKFGKPVEEKILTMLKNSEHGKYLISLGFAEDLNYSSKIDSVPQLPVYHNGTIKLQEAIENEINQKLPLKKMKISK